MFCVVFEGAWFGLLWLILSMVWVVDFSPVCFFVWVNIVCIEYHESATGLQGLCTLCPTFLCSLRGGSGREGLQPRGGFSWVSVGRLAEDPLRSFQFLALLKKVFFGEFFVLFLGILSQKFCHKPPFEKKKLEENTPKAPKSVAIPKRPERFACLAALRRSGAT